MKEWHRTVILILLLIMAVSFLLWTREQLSTNFLESF